MLRMTLKQRSIHKKQKELSAVCRRKERQAAGKRTTLPIDAFGGQVYDKNIFRLMNDFRAPAGGIYDSGALLV